MAPGGGAFGQAVAPPDLMMMASELLIQIQPGSDRPMARLEEVFALFLSALFPTLTPCRKATGRGFLA
jgi:hypothetical protein